MESILNYTVKDILEILGEVPQFEGLYIYFQRKEIKEVPFSFPYRTNNFTVHFIIKGEVSLKLDLIDYNLSKGDLIVIPPKTVIEFNWVAKDAKLLTVSFSLDFAFSAAKNIISSLDFFTSIRNEKISPDKQQWDTFITIASLLEKKNSLNSDKLYRSEIVSYTFKLFLYELAVAYDKNRGNDSTNSFSRKEELTFRFLKLLENNYKTRRRIDFYADNLSVSASYLSKVIKEASGKTVRDLMDELIITEAKLLLADPSLSVSQISNELEFSDQSFFSKFFKKRTELSPSEYRLTRGDF